VLLAPGSRSALGWLLDSDPHSISSWIRNRIRLAPGSGTAFGWLLDPGPHSIGSWIWIRIRIAPGSGSAFDWLLDPDPHSIGSLIQIRISNQFTCIKQLKVRRAKIHTVRNKKLLFCTGIN
jgi:hypothetical protein